MRMTADTASKLRRALGQGVVDEQAIAPKVRVTEFLSVIEILQQLEQFDSEKLLRHTLAVDRLNRRRLRFWFWVLIVAAAASVWPWISPLFRL